MGKAKLTSLFILLSIIGLNHICAQPVSSASDNLVTQPVTDRIVLYNLSDEGVSLPITWGLDLAWLSVDNIRRGVAFMGSDRVDVVRSSFMPTSPLLNGELQGEALTNTNLRMNIIDTYLGTNTQVVLNCDHPSVDSWYLGNAINWASLIDVTTRMHQERGRTVISVSPFNEPDYGWGQYTGSNGMSDFYNIVTELKKNSRFTNIRISGGNTLNCDEALSWYNYINPAGLTEGNTHQLAGSFDKYASFFQAVRTNGDHATADELHNVMEAMVGVEYGMQTGIWWGTAEYARSEFVKASDGTRLGYAEHRPNWTAASVYRGPDGKVQAFGGTSERQAVTTSYRFVSKDRDVYYNGHGPQREYTMELPGGTGYQQGQTNAENVVNITWGTDIQPIIDGRYVIVNRNSKKVMEVAGGSTSNGANIQQGTSTGATYQQWNVIPVDTRIGGDFSYFTFTVVNSGKSADVYNWSLDNNGNIALWDDTKGANQQWYLEYAEDGWFYIRSRHSAKCLHVANASSSAGANIMQWEKNGQPAQQWRFIPVGVPVEFTAPDIPQNLVATPQSESVRLDWSASTATDLSGYAVLRAQTSDGEYNTIARNVTTTSFVDNTATISGQYFYKIKAVDNSLNSSGYSNVASATVSDQKALVAKYEFEGNINDASENMNNLAANSDVSYIDGKVGTQALVLNGDDNFIQLPATIANQQEITVTTWVYWENIGLWQRIFDFGNGEDAYMFLTPFTNTRKMRFAIKNGGAEQIVEGPPINYRQWTHIAVTIGSNSTRLYIDGVQVAESTSVTISPMDFKPVLNYIGRSQFAADPMFGGYIDDFRIYNYALSADEVAAVEGGYDAVKKVDYNSDALIIFPTPADDLVYLSYKSGSENATVSIYQLNGKLVKTEILKDDELNVSDMPSGIYMLKYRNKEATLVKKLVVRH
ncbi:LamG-like jellyroll fold domain-containing protein [Saccharicrinis sp. FJH62]|uniref:LamG-like jellyroll fold domain-containing protein n=1 Tax=Saccharicrinis sp. FJH62 TaxID=3344657 RepID=UPI0035D3E4F5